MGGDPTKISLKSISTDRAFGHFSVNIHRRLGSSFLRLKCPSGRRVSAVEFASYGNPTADFGNFAVGSCHSTNSISVVEKVMWLVVHLSDGQSVKNYHDLSIKEIS